MIQGDAYMPDGRPIDEESLVASGSPIDRRAFLKRVGGGVVVLFATGLSPFRSAACMLSARPADYNAYLRIAGDGRVTCFTGKIEMGQGIITSLAQMLADELDVEVENVDMVMGDTDLCPFDRGTWGSLSTRVFGPELRAAAAEARAVLLHLASERMDVPVDRLDVEGGVVVDRSETSHSITYAQLTQGAMIVRDVDVRFSVKDIEDFRIMGTPLTRSDAREKVTGAAKFAADMRVPGMLYARILRPPAHGASIKTLDTSLAEAMDGVLVERDRHLVAVLHERKDLADRALDLIDASYEIPESSVDESTIYDHLLGVAPEGSVVAAGGDLAEGERSAATVFEETYLNAYVAHAPMEPHAALAAMQDDRLTVWASTQNPFGLKQSLSSVLSMDSERIRVITPFVGGGFGGKSANGQAIQAARLAVLVGRPVQVAWTREDEFFWDTFRPAAVVKIRAGMTSEGSPAFWDYRVYFAGARGSEQPYDFPHHTTVAYGRGWTGPEGTHPFATGAWRAPSANTNAFARESHIDILASSAGLDPLDFRLKHCVQPRIRGVLRAAAERFDRTHSAGPSGRGYGVACGMDADTFVATMAEVEVDESSGRVRVKRVVCAQDMGLVVNPAGATIQVEGCITMGLGYALSEELRFRGGEILDLNFDRYQLPLFSWVPEIETVLVDSGDPEPHGGGEPAIITMGAVIANAIFDATGVRLFELPMTPPRVKNALDSRR
jgi:isoquinoline 1-oxidoreductase